MVWLALPFYVAAEGVDLFDRRFFAGEDGIDGVAQLVGFGQGFHLWVVVHAACVAELALLIEDVKMRCAEGAVGEGDFLRIISQIGEGEILFLGAGDHVLEGIEGVLVCFIGIDCDELDAFGGVVFGEAEDSCLAADNVGAVVAGEEDDEEFGGFEVGEGIVFSVDAGEVEVFGGVADL